MKINGLTRLLIFSFLLFAIVGFGQIPQNLTPEDPQYQILKDSGQLPPDFETIYQTSDSLPNSQVTNPPADGRSSTLCNCLIPIDATFSVVPFSGYSGPNYRNDDGSSPNIPIPFSFCLYNNQYNSLYINNNGNVSFGTSYGTFSSSSFPSNQYVMVAPFWADVDTRGAASGLVYYKVTPTHIIVRWRQVGYYSSMTDKLNDFQLILTNGNDSIIPLGTNVSFCYGDMQWTTGSASGGSGGFGGTPATVGANKGDGVAFAQFGRFSVNSAAYDGPGGANDGINWLDNKSFFFNTCTNNNNIAPIPTGLNFCDTTDVCAGDTLNFNTLQFLSPEANQITTVTVNPTGVPNFTGSATTGNISTVTATFTPTAINTGYNTLTFVATDNANPPASTVINLVIYVNPPPQKPVITGDSILCPGENSVLSCQAGYTNYLWTPGGSITNTQNINAAGNYVVQYDSGGCTAYDTITVIAVPNPIPAFSPPLSSCNSGTAFVVADPGYATYSWLPNQSVNDTVNLLPGNYTLTVTDTNGCTGTTPVNINLISSITVSLVDTTQASCTAICNGNAQVLVQNNLGNVTYSWTPNVSSNDIASNLCVGNYMVVVTDTAGCDDTLNIPITSVYEVTTQVIQADPLCYNVCNGQITINPLTGVAPYNYSWSPNSLVTSYDNALCDGTYYITTTDANGCMTADTITLVEPPELRVLPSSTDETCPGFCDGTASLNISGGTPQYITMWSNGEPTTAITDLCDGIYDYTVTDANGCEVTGSVEINTIPPPVALFSNSAAQSDGLNPTVTFVDGSSSDVTQWAWDFGAVGSSSQQHPVITFPGVGSYDVVLIVTNNYGCTDTAAATIEIQDINVLYIPSGFTPNRDGLNDVFMPKGVLDNSLDYVLYIFNRWGERIFITHSLFEGWDGTAPGGSECPIDVYLYRIVVTDPVADTKKTYTGRVNLVR